MASSFPQNNPSAVHDSSAPQPASLPFTTSFLSRFPTGHLLVARRDETAAGVAQSGGGARRVLAHPSQGVLLSSWLTFFPSTRFAQQLLTLLGCVHWEIPGHESLLVSLFTKMQQPQLLSFCSNTAPMLSIFIVRQKKTHLI